MVLHWTVHVDWVLLVVQSGQLACVPVSSWHSVLTAPGLALVQALRLGVVLLINRLKLRHEVAPLRLSLAFPELLEDRVIVAVGPVVSHVDEVLRVENCISVLH